ncbi:hypothetical protein K504DRAFT_451736 [Pleomassaria siparia CBS 279.74]|uniref:Uncharacterized protein n=1 Tax=Pleomassaria siparia CBS 279.74 TaxID=1314801 RepID=A0A6G1JRT9_9PLEO|nr:hypothetical protein K504DRAFT_451736 [Pleomassaria siparia CBS 279.74]
MLPALQPSRPKQQQQQQRSVYAPPHSPSSSPAPHVLNPSRPRNQVEAMPPFGPTHHPFSPPKGFYDSAVRHPVFFTSQLKKPPFPIPEIASRGWSPVASGYIMESKRAEANGASKTKL